MTKFTSILDLKETIPEDSWSWVIPALRQDPLVWNSLQDSNLLKSAIQRIGPHPRCWTPMNIALVALGLDLKIEELRSHPLEELSPHLQQQVNQAYERFTSTSSPNVDLRISGLLALYFNEHESDIKQTTPRTSLACLYSILPQPLEIISQLKPEIVIHVILSNPQKPEEQIAIFWKYIKQADTNLKPSILRYLSYKRPRIATQIAREMLNDWPTSMTTYNAKFINNSPLNHLATIIANTEILSIANQEDRFLSQVDEALGMTEEIQADLTTSLIEKDILAGDIEKAYIRWKRVNKIVTPIQAANVFLTLVAQNNKMEAVDWCKNQLSDDQQKEPEYLLARGYLGYLEKNVERAKTFVLKSLAGFTKKDEPKLDHLHILTRLAMDINLPHEALEAVNLALELEPNDIVSINLLRECNLALDRQSEAIEAAHLAVCLKPDCIQYHRELAKTMEIANQWSHALQVRSAIMSQHESFNQKEAYQDAFNFAVCALKIDHPQNTAGVCQKLLKINPDDSEVHHLLGQTYLAMGDQNKAQAHFSQATRLAPDVAKSWLALADIFKETGQKSRQKETLQAAANIVTNDPEIFLVLGQIHLEEASPTQALQDFRNANRLANAASTPTPKQIKSKIALLLGETLDQLGHHFDARSVLENAYQADKGNMQLAHAYARSLLSTESPKDALPILNETRKKAPDLLDINLDFAKACLATTSNLDETRDALLKILDSNPDHTEAKALLAETYEANQEFDLSLKAYQEALSSSLREDTNWFTRLSIGLGKVYLGKNQPENAIAVLNSALKHINNEEKVLKLLSKAYHSANLREKAIWAARSVFDLNPADEGNLDWFIQQAIDMGATNKAIEVLEEKTTRDNTFASHLIKLGWLYVYEGEFDKARKAFYKIKNIEQVTSAELHQASKGLLAIEDAATAIDLIEKAIHLSNTSGNKKIIPELLLSKIIAYQKRSARDLALKTVETAIEISPDDPVFVSKKAEVLLDLLDYKEAIKCIEEGLDKFPTNTNLHFQAANIYRSNGQLLEASTHTRKVIELCRRNEKEVVDPITATIVTDLADAMIQTSVLDEIIGMVKENSMTPEPVSIHFHCLRGEIALGSDDEMQAADSLNAALEINPVHPRTLALQARLTSRQEDHDNAEKILQKALKTLGNYPTLNTNHKGMDVGDVFYDLDYPVSTYIAVGKASLEFNEWQSGITLLKKAVELSPEEPRSHFQFARALVLRAENQRLCDTLDVIKHAPGRSAVANFAYKEFETAILQAAHIVARFSQSVIEADQNFNDTKDRIATWLARGQAVFQPSHEHAKAIEILPDPPDNIAALLAALRECGDMDKARKIARDLLGKTDRQKIDPRLLAQIALTIAEESPDLAMDSSQKAIDLSRWQKLPEQPIFYAIAALVAKYNNDIELQKQFLQNALEIWKDEPIWLSTIADLYLQSGKKDDIEESILYLEKASRLEPKNIEYYLKLGKAHQCLGNPKGTIIVLDQATRVLPKRPEPWMFLAKAHHANGEIPQAIRCANTVIQLDPKIHEAPFLLAKISLEVNNPQKAARYIKDVLDLDPENPEALILSTKIFSALNKPEQALESLEKVLPILSYSIPLQLQRAQLVQETKGTEDALEILTQLNKEHPQTPQLLAAIAEIYSTMNQPENAIQKAQEALNAADENLSRKEHLATLTLLGRLLRKTGHLDQSLYYLNKAIEKDPKNSGPFIELGRCYQEQRLFDRALQHYQNAIQISPEDYQPYYHAGLVFKEIKDFVNAEKMFKTAAKLAPKNMNIYRQLAAVTAINFVQHHQSRSETDNTMSMAVPMESIKNE